MSQEEGDRKLADELEARRQRDGPARLRDLEKHVLENAVSGLPSGSPSSLPSGSSTAIDPLSSCLTRRRALPQTSRNRIRLGRDP